MTISTVTGTVSTGITLVAAVYDNPVTVGVGAYVSGATGVSAQDSWSIVNYGTVAGTDGDGIALAAGGGITNIAGALIQGNFGIYVYGTAATALTNAGTIIGSSGTAVLFGGGDDLMQLLPGSVITGAVDGGAGTNTLELGGTGAGSLAGLGTAFVDFQNVNVDAGANWTLTGTNTVASGVALFDAGTFTNSGTIDIYGAPLIDAGMLVNTGTISATTGAGVLLGGTLFNKGAGAMIAGAGRAVYDNALLTPGPRSVINDGTITGLGGSSVGVFLKAGGSVTNTGPQSTITGSYGVRIYGHGDIENSGTISGTYESIYLTEGTIANLGTAALITHKIDIQGGRGTLINEGVVSGNGYGVFLHAGGAVTNAANAYIAGYYFGVGSQGNTVVTNAGRIRGIFTGVSFLDAADSVLINSGTIVSYGSRCVQFGDGNDLLEITGGAFFSGVVDGGAGTNVLELAAGGGNGTISGIGTDFQHFRTVTVDAGASWSLSGSNATYRLNIGGTLTNTAAIVRGKTYVGSGGREIVASGGHAGGVLVSSGGTLRVASGGTASNIMVSSGGAIVYAGGSIVGVTVLSGGKEGVVAGVKVSGLTVGAGVSLTVSSGGTASNTVLGGGTEIVSSGGVIAGAVTFGANAKLSVTTIPTSKTLTLSGFRATDTLDLKKFGFKTTDKLSFVENAAKTSGVMTISSGTLRASVTLFGQYVAGGFHLAADGAGGTAISYSTSATVGHLHLAGSRS